MCSVILKKCAGNSAAKRSLSQNFVKTSFFQRHAPKIESFTGPYILLNPSRRFLAAGIRCMSKLSGLENFSGALNLIRCDSISIIMDPEIWQVSSQLPSPS